MNELEKKINQKQNQIIELLNEIGYGTACNPSTSGEKHALEFALKNTKNPVIFDVGAYHGEFFRLAYDMFYDKGIYHCFEPDPVAFEFNKKLLIGKLQIEKNIILNNFAISEKNGHVTLYNDKNDSGLASLCKRELSSFNIDFSNEQLVKTQTLFRYCFDNKVSNIDYLKLDIEGFEFFVLNSASTREMIEEGRIKNIQFEFGGACIDSRVFFRDFYILLGNYYNIYRIHPEGLIPIKDYRETYEIFQPVNYYCKLK